MLPVVHVADFGDIEEDAQRLGGEAAVVIKDVVAQGGDPALGGGGRDGLVVLARVAQEDFVGSLVGWHGESWLKDSLAGKRELVALRVHVAEG